MSALVRPEASPRLPSATRFSLFWLLSFICLLVLISKNKTPTTFFPPPLTFLRQSPHFVPSSPPYLWKLTVVVRLWRRETKSLINEQSVNHWSAKFNKWVSFPPCVHLYIYVCEPELVLAPYYQSTEKTSARTEVKWCLFHYQLNEWGRRKDGGFIRLSLSGARPRLAGRISVWYKAKTATFQLRRGRHALQSASLARRVWQKKKRGIKKKTTSWLTAGLVVDWCHPTFLCQFRSCTLLPCNQETQAPWTCTVNRNGAHV